MIIDEGSSSFLIKEDAEIFDEDFKSFPPEFWGIPFPFVKENSGGRGSFGKMLENKFFYSFIRFFLHISFPGIHSK